MECKKPRGTQDLYKKDAKEYIAFATIVRDNMNYFNFEEIITPSFESYQLYERGVGDQTDIVQKEMYVFKDRKDRLMALRPEGTAGVIRAVVENKLYISENLPLKLFYLEKCYRYERPQHGRNREFTQYGIEIFSNKSVEIDVECLMVAVSTLWKLGYKNKDFKILINYLVSAENKKRYLNDFKNHAAKIKNLCEDCQIRLEKNPLRLLDCKICNDLFEDIPDMVDYLDSKEKIYFDTIIKLLNMQGLEVEIDSHLVRGLDYYTGFIFEIQTVNKDHQSQLTLLGGGRYDNLVAELNGPNLSGVGFGMGVDRVLLDLKSRNISLSQDLKLDAYLICLSEKAKRFGSVLLTALRCANLCVDLEYQDRSLKSAFKQAEKYQSKNIIIIGDKELENNTVTIKDQITNEEHKVNIQDVVKYFNKG